MSILNEHGRHGSSSADDDYQIEKSLVFQDTNSPYLHRTPSSNGNKRTWTLSTWCKLADAVSAPAHMTLFGAASGYQTHCMFRNSGGFEFAIGNGSSANYWSATSALFRDYSAWYHVVLAVDTTNGTAADRAKVYINGVRQTAFSTNNTANIPQNFDTCVNHTSHQMRVGAQNTSSNFMDGLLAEYHFIDGQALTPSSFGETDNAYRHWKPKAYTGSYGTNGFYLKFGGNKDITEFIDETAPTEVASYTDTSTSPRLVGLYTGDVWSGYGGTNTPQTGTTGTAQADFGPRNQPAGHIEDPAWNAAKDHITLSTSIKKWGTSSIHMSDGGNSAFQVQANNWQSDFQMGTDPFTFECWIYIPTGASGNGTLLGGGYHTGQTNKNFHWMLNNSNGMTAILSNGTSGSQTTISGSSALSRDTWHHIALSRAASNNWGLYADGSRIAHSTTSVTLPRVRNDWTLCGTIPGAGGVSYHDFLGECYIDNLRITRGIGYYSGTTYTVPTAAFLKPSIKPDPNADVTHSTAQKKIGRSSIAFDGTGDMLEIPGYGQHKFDFWDDNWTMECWARLNTVGARQGILTFGTEADRGWKIISFHNTNGWNVSRDMDSNVNNFSITEGSVSASINTWYHLALVRNGSTITFYVDGVQTGTPVTGVSGNFLTEWASSSDDQGRHLTIGAQYNDSGVREDFFNGYLDEIRISKVARYTSNNFTPPTTQFTEDANTVLLIHSDYDGGLGHDSSGQNNHFTKSGLTSNDQYVDTPTNNFCVWNPLSTPADYGECNTKVITTVSGSVPYKQVIYGSMQFSSTSGGKWYWEVDVINVAGLLAIGTSYTERTNQNRHNNLGSAGANIYAENGNAHIGSTTYGSQPTYGVGDIISVAVDEDNNKIYFAKNNTWLNSANPSAGTNGWTLSSSGGQGFGTPLIVNNSTGSNVGVIANFGQDSAFAGAQTDQNGGNTDSNGEGDFYYTPPTGFLALCSNNLRLKFPPSVQPKKNFNTVLYTGNGGAKSVTGVGFEPSLVWIKERTTDTRDHQLFDKVRGVNKSISINTTGAQQTRSGHFNSFDGNGWTMNTSDQNVNANGNSYLSFHWKFGSSTSTNNDGSAASTVIVNNDAKMSIVQYEGTGSAQTIGHGLGVTPAFVVVKNFDGSNVNWNMWHKSFTNSQYMRINLNNARLTETNCWGAGDVTSSVIGLGSHDENNESGETHIAYCFAEGDGWCSAGTYNGNALADGAFIYTGFRPAFIWIKNTETNHSHLIKDTETETGNFLTETGVFTNSTKGGPNDIDAALAVDIVSNGFKARYGGGTFNSANTFLFMAFAEYPFTHTNAR